MTNAIRKTGGPAEIEAFLTPLAVAGKVARSTQNQAFNALLFLYREVLGISLDDAGINARGARKKGTLPVVLIQDEVRRVIMSMPGVHHLIPKFLYGSGLRLIACLRLRVPDLDFNMQEVTVRGGKGEKDRLTLFPEAIQAAMHDHLERVRILHEKDLADGYGRVYRPHALPTNTPTPSGNGAGSMCFRQTGCRKTQGQATSDGIMSTRRQCNGPCTTPPSKPGW